jgi:uncharacterized membrane protein
MKHLFLGIATGALALAILSPDVFGQIITQLRETGETLIAEVQPEPVYNNQALSRSIAAGCRSQSMLKLA